MTRSLIIGILLLVSSGLWGQSDAPVVTNKYYIKDAMLISSPGVAPRLQSIIIDDGMISQVGTNLTVPYDAIVVDADSMYVYPGFIAGLSKVGAKRPEKSNDTQKVPRPGYPPNEVAGITPERSISEQYSASESTIKDFRNAGFGLAHTVPHGGMMSGMGAVISLTGGDYYEAVLHDDASLYATFDGGPRVFPATTIGVMAKWREIYKNSALARDHKQAYRTNARNKKRPSQDPSSEALFPVVAGDITVYFEAPEHLDMYRALKLQDDLGFKMIISDVKQGYHIASKLKRENVQVVLSLDLADELKDKENEDDEMTEEMKKLTLKKKMAIDQQAGTAALYHDQDVPFSFSLIDVKGKDVLPAVRRLISAGLTHDAALAALTTVPANQLGISQMAGTVSSGKIANMIIATDSIFNEKAEIKTVFVDGQKYDLESKKKKKDGDEDSSEDIAGLWDYSIEVPGITPTGKMRVEKDGDDYKVFMSSDQQNPDEFLETENVELSGSTLTFEYSIDYQGMALHLETLIEFDDDSYEGNVSIGELGAFTVTGTKISSPE